MPSDKFSSVRVDGDNGYLLTVFNVRGHVSYEDALTETERAIVTEIRHWEQRLTLLRNSTPRVFHQTGIYRVHNRKEVYPNVQEDKR